MTKNRDSSEELDEFLKLERLLRREKITEPEAIHILKSSRSEKRKGTRRIPIVKKHVKYGYFSDPHIGHEKFSYPLFEKMVRLFKQEAVDFIVTPGDHLEGMSGRPGHIYELTHVGFNQQIVEAADLYNQLPTTIYGIDGNHDQWYYKKNNGGIVVGDSLETRVGNYHNLGQDEGDLEIAAGIFLKLFHANDGTAYATSYKLQKLVESFDEREKPDIIHSGHYHKALYMHIRGVHGFESGTLCGQSRFMRGRKLPAHMGFGIVDVYYNKGGIGRLEHTWVPYNPNI